MVTRQYVSELRASGAAEKRQRVIEVARQILRQQGVGSFSLDTVAKAAGVTRLTVYNQFGSRRGLLEAVFDEIAARGGLADLADSFANPDPRRGLEDLIGIFCRFWSSDPALAALHDATVVDEEFGQALSERTERRRDSIRTLVEEIAAVGIAEDRKIEVIDLIYTLTTCATFVSLSRDRSPEAVERMIVEIANDAMDRLAGKR